MKAQLAAKQVALLVLDVDGVMTDGGVYYDSNGLILKRFHIHDSLGIKLAQAAGLQLAVISGLDTPAVACRMQELGIEEYHPGRLRKEPILREISAKKGIALARMAYLGDDWLDASVMRLVGLPMAVADAQPEIKDLALWTSSKPGGQGAVREAVRFILEAKGQLEGLYENLLK